MKNIMKIINKMCKACHIVLVSPYTQTKICKLRELKNISHEKFHKMIAMKNFFRCMEQLKYINIHLIENYKVNKIYIKYLNRTGFDFSSMRD